MGLDMYLSRRPAGCLQEVAYWRKVNAVHNWFVTKKGGGIDECQEIRVDTEDLRELLDLCKQVKAIAILKDGQVSNGYRFDARGNKEPILVQGKIIANAEEIDQLLPTQSGFFFGSTDYDDWYMEGIDMTIEQIEKILAEDNGDYEYVYQASW